MSWSFEEFLSALNGNDVEVISEISPGLREEVEEFGFHELKKQCWLFQ
jgi:hypothetical protein